MLYTIRMRGLYVTRGYCDQDAICRAAYQTVYITGNIASFGAVNDVVQKSEGEVH